MSKKETDALYRERNRVKINEKQRLRARENETFRIGNLKYKYGITIDQYNLMFKSQNGCCFICKRHQSEFKRRLAVDHCHQTGLVRSLLCFNCNSSLGHYENNKLKFEKYLNDVVAILEKVKEND